MTSKKVYYGLLGLMVFTFVLAAAGTYYGTVLLKKTGNDLHDAKLKEAVLEKDEEVLAQAKRDIDEYGDLENIARAIVPQEKDQARTVREIVNIAQRSGIKLSSISFPASTLGEAQKGKPAAGASDLSQLSKVEGLNGVYEMPISLESDSEQPVLYSRVLKFLSELEKNRRTSNVTNVSLSPSAENRDLVNISLQINVYIKP